MVTVALALQTVLVWHTVKVALMVRFAVLSTISPWVSKLTMRRAVW